YCGAIRDQDVADADPDAAALCGAFVAAGAAGAAASVARAAVAAVAALAHNPVVAIDGGGVIDRHTSHVHPNTGAEGGATRSAGAASSTRARRELTEAAVAALVSESDFANRNVVVDAGGIVDRHVAAV